uniref:ribonuclease H n=1 Tax=Fopius arisanus TaxID=64838 RepID=A0A0C9RJJ9_9HYME
MIKCICEVLPLKESLYIDSNYHIFTHSFDAYIVPIVLNDNLGRSAQEVKETNRVVNEELQRFHQDYYRVFTDGSKNRNNNYVGAACVCPELNTRISTTLNRHSSSYTAECIALTLALKFIKENPGHKYAILTDSLSACQELNSGKLAVKTNPFSTEIRQLFIEITKESNPPSEISIIWIPSHCGIEGNEEADKLAGEAEDDSSNEFRVPFTDFRALFKREERTETSNKIVEIGKKKGAEYFELFYKESARPWYGKCKLSRECIVTVNRVRANHYHLAASLARVGISNDPSCSCGAESQTFDHILWHCPRYDQQRNKLVDRLIKKEFPRPYTTKKFLDATDFRYIEEICKYLNDCQIQI